MSKRFAGSQMTREGLENGDSRSGSDDETGMEKPKIASESVMSTRKIAMPKRKMGNFNTGEKPNMFKLMKNNNTNVGIKPQEKDTTADTNEKIAALNLQFKSKIVATLDSDPVADLSLLFDKYKTYLQSLKPTKFQLLRLLSSELHPDSLTKKPKINLRLMINLNLHLHLINPPIRNRT